MKNQKTNSFVNIIISIWLKISHGLYDYESTNFKTTYEKIINSSTITQKDENITIRTLSEDEITNDHASYSIEKSKITIMRSHFDECYILVKNPIDNSYFQASPLFFNIRNLKDGYPIKSGDVIRFGRIDYKVIEFQDHNLNISSIYKTYTNDESYPFSLAIKKCKTYHTDSFVNDHSDSETQCRICSQEQGDSDNPLINPCNCKGSNEVVHLKCIQDWINRNMNKTDKLKNIGFIWKNELRCEICQTEFPDLVHVNEEKIRMLSIPRQENPYILLERFDKEKEKDNENQKAIFLISFPEDIEKIMIGRQRKCDIIETDISISRLHASLKYKDGEFRLYDNNSKFGTLVQLRENFLIEKDKIEIQVDRTLFTISLEENELQE